MKKKPAVPSGRSDVVMCQECGFEGHILMGHLREAHGMTALAYSEAHPGAALMSKAGAEAVKGKLRDSSALTVPDREVEDVTIESLFGEGFVGEQTVVRRFKGDAPWVPPGTDDGYCYNFNATMALLYALHRERINSVWIAGYAGTGKTQLVLNVCRRLNREVVRVNLDSSITRGDIVGDWTVIGGETKFKYGLLPQAMKRGAVLLLDEYDLGNPYVVALFRPVLEAAPRLVILENGGEVVTPHPDFRVVATANTFGSGDSSGLYGTTHTLSLADRQRFGLFIQMDYLEESIEVEMLLAAVPDLEEENAKALVQIAGRVRSHYKEGKIEESLSPRQLVNWAEVYADTGNAMTAANMAFLLPLGQASQMAIRQLIEESGIIKG